MSKNEESSKRSVHLSKYQKKRLAKAKDLYRTLVILETCAPSPAYSVIVPSLLESSNFNLSEKAVIRKILLDNEVVLKGKGRTVYFNKEVAPTMKLARTLVDKMCVHLINRTVKSRNKSK